MQFVFTPPPEEGEDVMATRHQPLRTATTARRVKSADFPDETPKIASSGSEWGKRDLVMLGVRFPLKGRIDLNKILNVDESQWADNARKRMKLLCNIANHFRGRGGG